MRFTEVYRDNRGTIVRNGDRVAFNISGDVAIGQVVACGNTFKIALLHKAAGHNVGHISKVKKANSIIVLRESEA